MNIEVLDSKQIEGRSWYLCKGNLFQYLDNLNESFYDYAIQRRIVKNYYLDSLFTTIKDGDPIPIITLTYEGNDIPTTKGLTNIDMQKIEILDGLQRTFRLWVHKIIHEEFQGESASEFASRLKAKRPLFFESGVITSSVIRRLIDNKDIDSIKASFEKYDIYFIIWAGLNEAQVVDKMLVLNAGQKSVSSTHQYELMFLHFFQRISNGSNNLKLYREKDTNANNIKKGDRFLGEFLYSSFIVGLESFIAKNPKRVDPNTLNRVDFDFEIDSESPPSLFKKVFSTEFLQNYMNMFYQLDTVISEDSEGKKWFSKDTSISGVMAALGAFINIDEEWTKENLITYTQIGINKLITQIDIIGLNLIEFNYEYNELSSRSVNIGSFIRKAVMLYVYQLLMGNIYSWHDAFKDTKERRFIW